MRPGALTSAIPCRAASPERGRTSPACPGGISSAMPVATLARSPAARVTGSAAWRSSPASPSCANAGIRAPSRSFMTFNSTERKLLVRAGAVAVDGELREAVHQRRRDPCSHEHTVTAIRPLEVAGHVVELREPVTGVVRHQQLELAQGRCEGVLDEVAQIVD